MVFNCGDGKIDSLLDSKIVSKGNHVIEVLQLTGSIVPKQIHELFVLGLNKKWGYHTEKNLNSATVQILNDTGGIAYCF